MMIHYLLLQKNQQNNLMKLKLSFQIIMSFRIWMINFKT